MKNRFILSIFLLLCCLYNSQVFNFSSNSKKIAETLIFDTKKINNPHILEDKKDSIMSSNMQGGRKKINQIVFDVLIAEKKYKIEDGINPESTQYYLNAIRTSTSERLTSLEIWSITNYAYYLYKYRKMQESLPYILQATNLLQKTNERDVIEPGETFKKLGYYLLTIDQKEEALKFLEKSIKYNKKNPIEHAALLDNIANIYLNTNETDKAKPYLDEALQIVKKSNDKIRYAKILGNQALYHEKRKEYSKAIDLYKKDIEISKQHNAIMNTMYALTQLSKVFLKTANYDEAQKYAEEANVIAKSKEYYNSNEYEITGILLKIAEVKKQDNEELLLRRKLDQITDSLKNTDGNEAIEHANWIAQKEIVNNKLEIEKTKYEKENLRKKISYFAVGLLAIFSGMWIMVYRNKSKNELKKHELKLLELKHEKVQSEKKLSETAKTLSAYTTYLSEKNKQIESLEEELEKVQHSKSLNTTDRSSEINELLKSHLMTEENWQNFKEAFTNEKPEYYKYLKENFTELTESNLRLVMLIKLGLDNKKTAQILGITQDAVKKAKQRLRKKLLDRYDVLFRTDNEG